MSQSFAHERRLAELAVQRAAVLTEKVLKSVNKGEISKNDSTPVTIADFAAQALLIGAIHKAFPSDGFIGEEDSNALKQDESLRQRVWELVSSTHLEDEESDALLATPSSIEEVLNILDLGGRGAGGRTGRIWMLDPIDGTAAFIRGEQYAISLALVEDGQEVLGVLGCPNLNLETGRVHEQIVDKEGMGLMISAVKGEGAVIRPIGRAGLQTARRIEVSSTGPDNLKDLHFVDWTGSAVWRIDKIRKIADQLGASYPGTEVWSSHMRYVALIVGGGDVQLRIPVKKDKASYVWDHAGAQLIFKEVGGKITDLNGDEIDFGAGRELSNNWGMIVVREGLYPKIWELTQEALDGGDVVPKF
ncbi:3',5'-bisphosphate nucleotidase-3 [Coleophoma crateriformis]|uniref:3',5'-bisphosphate nucleotidase-3 n=1 Tax=Coleophoma crateriformis TaxID=565419 RepID=A0A3D8S3K0_9HELO|nr:3',5'-bisphosphate nucleotidase-3 [Coleophoma crateriformis]